MVHAKCRLGKENPEQKRRGDGSQHNLLYRVRGPTNANCASPRATKTTRPQRPETVSHFFTHFLPEGKILDDYSDAQRAVWCGGTLLLAVLHESKSRVCSFYATVVFVTGTHGARLDGYAIKLVISRTRLLGLLFLTFPFLLAHLGSRGSNYARHGEGSAAAPPPRGPPCDRVINVYRPAFNAFAIKT